MVCLTAWETRYPASLKHGNPMVMIVPDNDNWIIGSPFKMGMNVRTLQKFELMGLSIFKYKNPKTLK